MVAVSVALMSEQHLSTNFNLYIHQDVTEVRLANENEGMKLFSAIKAIGAEYGTIKEKVEEKFIPINGAIGEDESGYVCIFNGKRTINFDSFHAYIDNNEAVEMVVTSGVSGYKFKPVTPEGLVRLTEALSKKGLIWNPSLKRIENKLWRAEKGGAYWYSSCAPETGKGDFFPEMEHDTYTKFDDAQYLCGDYSKTPEECQAVCDSLNAVLSDNLEKRKLVK